MARLRLADAFYRASSAVSEFRGRGIETRLLAVVGKLFSGARALEFFTGELSANHIRMRQRLDYNVVRKKTFPGSRYSRLPDSGYYIRFKRPDVVATALLPVINSVRRGK